MGHEDIYQRHQQELKELFNQILQASAPDRQIRNWVKADINGITVGDDHFPLLKNQHVWVFGTGKAAASMAQSLEEVLGDNIKDGIVITPHSTRTSTRFIQQFEASHPLPDRDSESATYELLNLTRKIPKDDLVLYCLSGGTSALLCLPAKGLELGDIRQTHDLLIHSGADISEINTVRKHISAVKGGQLLQHLKDTRLVDLVISDVPGDHLEDIGSGPTTPDSSTYQQAFQILKKYRIWEEVPHNVRTHLAKGMHHEIPETPKPGSDLLVNHRSHIIGSARHTAEEAVQQAQKKGYNTWIDEEEYSGDVSEVSKHITDHLKQVKKQNSPVEKPAVLVFYGESTVNVTGNGLGGRNQELALCAAVQLEDQHYISLLSGGTDGIDGPTDAAGAICNGDTARKARNHQYKPETFIDNNDSYHFFDAMGGHIKTGPTGNNVMDLQIGIVEE